MKIQTQTLTFYSLLGLIPLKNPGFKKRKLTFYFQMIGLKFFEKGFYFLFVNRPVLKINNNPTGSGIVSVRNGKRPFMISLGNRFSLTLGRFF